QRFFQGRQTVVRVEIADNRQFARLRTEVITIELRDAIVGDATQSLDRFFDGRNISDIVLGVWVESAMQQPGGELAGFGSSLLQIGQSLSLEHLELIGR